MPSKKLTLADEALADMIREIRGVRIIVDSDLLALRRRDQGIKSRCKTQSRSLPQRFHVSINAAGV